MKQKHHSWALIITLLFFFFPAGIVLLVTKMTSEKTRYEQNGKSLKIFAIVLFVLAVIYPILSFTGDLRNEDGTPAIGTGIMMLVFLTAVGTFTLWKGNQYIKRGQEYNRLLAEFATARTLDIDPIAQKMKLSYNAVTADLHALIDAGYIQNAYIDHLRRRLVIKPVARPTRAFFCPHCGGKSEIAAGAPVVCDYCDSPLT